MPEEHATSVQSEYFDGFQQTEKSEKRKQWSPGNSTEKFSSQEDRFEFCQVHHDFFSFENKFLESVKLKLQLLFINPQQFFHLWGF